MLLNLQFYRVLDLHLQLHISKSAKLFTIQFDIKYYEFKILIKHFIIGNKNRLSCNCCHVIAGSSKWFCKCAPP